MSYTYNDLLNQLQEMNAEQLESDVTVGDAAIDEFFPVQSLEFSKDGDAADGVLDHGHPYLKAN